MATEIVRVGVREFREDLAEYLASPTTVAITRHGQTVGYYVPVRRKVDERELQAFREAVTEIEALLAEYGISEDEIVREFDALRHQQ